LFRRKFAGGGLIEQNAPKLSEAEPAGAIYRQLGLLNKAALCGPGMHRI
jgi:hypothetical protein